VPVDPDFQTFNITAEQAELSITSRTTAIVPVHLYGLPVDLDPILEMAQAYGLKVVEDAAQAHGARYRGDRIGAHGDAVAWSFYPGKNLGGLGDGGAITTDNESIAERLAVLRNYGSRRKYENEVKGTNSRLDPIQAGVLGVKLNVLDEWNLRRKRLAEIYGEGLGTMLSSSGNEVSSLNLQTKHPSPELLSTPVVPEFAESAWHLFVIRVQSRDWVRRRLLDDFGVETGIHYPIPPVRQKAYFDEVPAPFGVADGLAGQVLSLPMGPHLSEADASYVIESLAAVLGS
jgi:dTDP-4-amino-4,6-dideoxygalactose transaminase